MVCSFSAKCNIHERLYALSLCVYPGTPLGDKTMEVAQKVATGTAEELKKSAAALDREIPGKDQEFFYLLH